MKKFFIAATAILLATASLQAQSQKDSSMHQHHRGMRGEKGGMQKLNLTEDQKKQFKDIKEGYHKQFTDLRNNKSLGAEEIKTKSEALRKEQHEKMQSLLTPEQKAKAGTWKKDGAANWKGRGEGKGVRGMHDRGQNFDKMKTQLGLTDDQAAKLKTNREGFREKMKAIRSNTSLSETQKKDQMKDLGKQQHENMKSILTADQLEKLKSARKSRGTDTKR